MDDQEKSYGQINFEAYAEAVGGKTFDDKPIPEWSALPEKVREGWEAGANAVIADIALGDAEDEDSDSDDEDGD